MKTTPLYRCISMLLTLTLLLGLAAPAIAVDAADDGLVAYWSFDNISGNTLVDDSGNGHDGTISGAIVTTGVKGNALQFDGIDDQVIVPHSDKLNFGKTDSYTLACWVKAVNTGNWRCIIQKGRNTQNKWYGLWTTSAGKFNAACDSSGVSITAGKVDSRWHYLVVTYDGTNKTRKFYVDGQLAETVSTTLTCETDQPLTMGGAYDMEYLNGTLDEAYLYDGVITASQIAQIYNENKPDESIYTAPKSDLPQVYVTVTDPNYTAAQLYKGLDYVDCTIKIVDPTGEFETLIDEGTSIKVRGNSTAKGAKKPFNIKLSSKTDVLGMGKGKKWSLLANMFDKTLMRNKLVFDMAEDMGMDYVCATRTVDVWLDGSYNGTYTLCEPVEIGSTRVDIDEDAGEYIFERERDRWESDATYLTTSRYGLRFVMDDPDEPTSEQVASLQAKLKLVEDAIATNNLETMAEYMDIRSFVDMYILQEYFKNADVDYSSVKFYFKDGLLYTGPIWDFDLTAGNYYSSAYNNTSTTGKSYEGLFANNAIWYRYLLKNADFSRMVRERYVELQPMIVNLYQKNELGSSRIDAFIDANKDSIAENWKVWSITAKDSTFERVPDKTYEENVEYLRNWLKNRNDWLLKNYALEHSITCEKSDLGSVEAAASALFSQTVTLKITPKVDEEALIIATLKKLSVTCAGAAVECELTDTTDNANGTTTYTYTFTMPDGDVKVRVEYDSVQGSKKAMEVEKLITAIGTVTLDSDDAIAAARDAYDALAKKQQAFVKNYQTLLDAEDAYEALVEAAAAAAASAAAQEYSEAAQAAAVAARTDADNAVAKADQAQTDAEEAKAKADEAKAVSDAAQASAAAAAASVGEDHQLTKDAVAAAATAKAKAEVAATAAAAAEAAAATAGTHSAEAKTKAEAAAEAAAEAKTASDAAAAAVEQKDKAAAEAAAATALTAKNSADSAAEAAAEFAAAAESFESTAANESETAAAAAKAAEDAAKLAAEAAATAKDVAAANALNQKKTDAAAELDSYAENLAKSSDANRKDNIIQALSAGKAAVEKAADADAVEAALQQSKKDMDAAAKCPSTVFADVDKGEWYHEAVDFMVEKGYMNGLSKTEFGVNGTVTRAQLVTILYRIAGEPSVAGKTCAFTDVSAGQWYTDAVIWAEENGFVNGINATTFAPDLEVTREQMVTILYRYDGTAEADEKALAGFIDAASIAGYAKDAFAWAVSNGVVNGMSETNLVPAGTATRAQICAIVMRYLSL